jgi:RND family efflux transporter MFP subunit
MRRTLTSTGLIVAALSIAGLAVGEARSVPVKVAPAVTLHDAPRLWVPGTVLSRQDADVGVEVPGRLISVVDPGTRVERGDTLAQLDDRRWRFQLAEAQSRVLRLEARLLLLDKEVERVTRLNAQENVARHRLDEVEAQRAMAVQDRRLAVTEQERAQYLIEQARIAAPFSGQVVERLAEAGEYAGEGLAVVRLVNLTRREVRAQAPLRVAPFLQERQVVPIRSGSGGTLQVPISTIIPVGDLGSRSFEIRLRVDALDWAIGSPVEVGLPTAAPRSAVAVPRDALVLRNEDTVVFRVNGDGTAERVLVTTGAGVGELVEVTGPIEVGDRVVIRGAETLRDGQTVELL